MFPLAFIVMGLGIIFGLLVAFGVIPSATNRPNGRIWNWPLLSVTVMFLGLFLNYWIQKGTPIVWH